MSAVAWTGGFVLLTLAIFHFSLFYIFHNDLHLFLSLGWFVNIPYIVIESWLDEVPSFLPFAVSTLSLGFFVLAETRVSGRGALQATLILLSGYALSFALLKASSGPDGFLIGTSGGALFSFCTFALLSFAVLKLRIEDFELLVRGRTDDLRFQLKPREVSGPLVDRFVDALQERARRGALLGKNVFAVAFLLFGLLQLSYPFKYAIKGLSAGYWLALFAAAMLFKLSTAVGASIMLRASATLVDAKVRRGSLAEELSKITLSVEHDMRAPLREMNLITKHLKAKFQHEPAVQRDARDLEGLILRIKAVMDLILSIRESEVDYGKRSDKCNLGNALAKASAATKALHSGRDVIVKLSLPAQPIHVHGYNERLTQALTNILNNAVEASLGKCEERVVVDARLKAMRSQGEAVVEIQDHGTGINSEDLPFVKEAYFSTKESSDRPNRGLGLFIADRILRLHGGSLKLESDPEEGTTASITLPWPETLRRR